MMIYLWMQLYIISFREMMMERRERERKRKRETLYNIIYVYLAKLKSKLQHHIKNLRKIKNFSIFS